MLSPVERFLSLQNDLLAVQKTNLAFFKGSHTPDLLIVGEAPGKEEDKAGVPFVGQSGRLLARYLDDANISGYQLAFLNAVFRMPLADDGVSIRKPSSGEIAHYRSMVVEIVEYLSPRYVLLLGNSAAESMLRTTHFDDIRGRWLDNVYMTFHPGFIMRHPECERIYRAHFKAVAERLSGVIPFRDHTSKRTTRRFAETTVMTDKLKIKAIEDQSKHTAEELYAIQDYILTDPAVSIAKARKLLESTLNRHLASESGGLSDKISQLADEAPGSVITQMHTVRRNGNTALHSDENLSPDIAKQTFEPLLSVLCWCFNIDVTEFSEHDSPKDSIEADDVPSSEQNQTNPQIAESRVRVRFFVAEGIYRTWPKVALLFDDGTFYSEYLAWNKLTTFRKEGFNFDTFKPTDFSFGEEEHGKGYQHLREVSYLEAINFKLVNQINWIERYMKENGLEPPTN